MRVTWKSIAPIFANVLVSPWNLIVGGILIQHSSFLNALLSIIFGYIILSIIFIFYGGLGFKERQQSSELLAKVFGSKIAKYIITLILAFGQIGWAAVNIDLGGRSLGSLFSLPWYFGILIYASILTAIALLNLYRLGLTKFFITISALGLMGYMFFYKLQSENLSQFINHQPVTQNSLFWGTSIIVASFISFATISPDFFQSVKTKKDVVLSTIFGLFPGALIALLGCFLFFDKSSLDLILLLSITAFAFFPHVFNTITNTDGAIALYTPGLKFQSILPINFRTGVIISAILSLILALTQISLHLPIFLNILSIIFPVLIGVCFSAFILQKLTTKSFYHREVVASSFATLIIAIGVSIFFPPVLVSLLTPIIFFVISISYTKLSVYKP